MYGYMAKPMKDKNISIPENMLSKLLTPSEVRMLKNRWKILGLLEKGLSIRGIAAEAEVGTDTVVRTIRMVEQNESLRRYDKQGYKSKIKTSTPWIFGKGN